MNPLTLEWIEKAEGDFATAGRSGGMTVIVEESGKDCGGAFHVWSSRVGAARKWA